MQFEDFNYALYNPYILVEKDSDAEDESVKGNQELTNKEITQARMNEYKF